MEDSVSLTKDVESSEDIKKTNFRKEIPNILFLMFLYMLQGVPTGLLFSIQFSLSTQNASYQDQGTFSLAGWPFTLKLLWAPFVDAIFWDRIGRRKSWLIPVQYSIGTLLIVFASYVQDVLGPHSTAESIHNEILPLTILFTVFITLAATQDIAVDGWGITILSDDHMEWASICNNAGATIGILIGNSLFLILDSADFCNKHIRYLFGLEPQTYGIMNIKEFMIFFGVIFVASTTLILIFKNEKNERYYENLGEDNSIEGTFISLWNILKLRPVHILITFLLTWKIAFAMTRVKFSIMIELGLPKEIIGIMNVPFQIIQIATPIFIGKFLNLKKPLGLYFNAYPMRMIMTATLAIWIYFSPWMQDTSGNFSITFMLIFAFLNGVYSLLMSTLEMTKVFFYTQISDKTIGGTYMTLLHTFSNIGFNWPATLGFYLLEIFTEKNCMIDNSFNLNATHAELHTNESTHTFYHINNNTCVSDVEKLDCLFFGGKCVNSNEAFYYLTAGFLVIGVGWAILYKKIMKKLERLPQSAWRPNLIKENLKKGLDIHI